MKVGREQVGALCVVSRSLQQIPIGNTRKRGSIPHFKVFADSCFYASHTSSLPPPTQRAFDPLPLQSGEDAAMKVNDIGQGDKAPADSTAFQKMAVDRNMSKPIG